jgi:tRNA-specific adenosine deaminase 1
MPMRTASHGLQDDVLKLGDELAQASIRHFNTLPKHAKPIIRSNGIHEWTILASISLRIPTIDSGIQISPEEGTSGRGGVENREGYWIQTISLGTGVKVLPASKLPPLGDGLHDCHAEILARRGFMRWLLQEATRIAQRDAARSAEEGVLTEEPVEDLLEWSDGKFRLKSGIQIWLYVSTLPVSLVRVSLYDLCTDSLLAVWGRIDFVYRSSPTCRHGRPQIGICHGVSW